jgi:hypothetical protein
MRVNGVEGAERCVLGEEGGMGIATGVEMLIWVSRRCGVSVEWAMSLSVAV